MDTNLEENVTLSQGSIQLHKKPSQKEEWHYIFTCNKQLIYTNEFTKIMFLRSQD